MGPEATPDYESGIRFMRSVIFACLLMLVVFAVGYFQYRSMSASADKAEAELKEMKR